MKVLTEAISPVMLALSSYMAHANEQPLADQVEQRALLHTVDTFGAMVSGLTQPAGKAIPTYVQSVAGRSDCSVVGTKLRADVVTAALANGVLAHADETDDTHAASLSHPGCSIVATAAAVGELVDASGTELLRAVVLGYDISTRMNLALNPYEIREVGHSTHSIGPTFGSAAAAAALLRLNESQMRHVLSFAAQQASGVSCWMRDLDHMEKAFDFGGMPARNGVTAAMMVHAGFTGVDDVFSGQRNFFLKMDESSRTGLAVDPARLVTGLGETFEIMNTSLKRFSVGAPVQAPLDGCLRIHDSGRVDVDDIASVKIGIAQQAVMTVNRRGMPSISAPHLCAVMLIDGRVTFESAHDHARMHDPEVAALADKIEVYGDERATAAMPVRQARVQVTLQNGHTVEEYVEAVRGSSADPMTQDEVARKVEDLLVGGLGASRTEGALEGLLGLRSGRVRDVLRLLA